MPVLARRRERGALAFLQGRARAPLASSRSRSFLLKSAVLMMQGEDGRAAARMRGAGGV